MPSNLTIGFQGPKNLQSGELQCPKILQSGDGNYMALSFGLAGKMQLPLLTVFFITLLHLLSSKRGQPLLTEKKQCDKEKEREKPAIHKGHYVLPETPKEIANIFKGPTKIMKSSLEISFNPKNLTRNKSAVNQNNANARMLTLIRTSSEY